MIRRYRYLILETINNKRYKYPRIFFYDGRKWREDVFYGDVKRVIREGKKVKKFGYDCIKF